MIENKQKTAVGRRRGDKEKGRQNAREEGRKGRHRKRGEKEHGRERREGVGKETEECEGRGCEGKGNTDI